MDKNVVMEFLQDGQLTYAIDVGTKRQIMNLTFQVDGDRILSNQPSAPRLEETQFWFEEPGTLVLRRGSQRSWFQRT